MLPLQGQMIQREVRSRFQGMMTTDTMEPKQNLGNASAARNQSG